MKKFVVVLALFPACALFAEKQPFERYQSILDRQPFGQPPPGFDPSVPPSEVSRGQGKDAVQVSQEQAALQKAVSFSVINVEPDGTVMVGFTDKTNDKSPRHYYLGVGETRDGWSVVSADSEARTMTVSKDSVEVTLQLGASSGGASSAASGTDKPEPGAVAPARSPLLGNRGGALAGGSFQSRRARREQEEAFAEAERQRMMREAAEREAAAKAEREAEREERMKQFEEIQAEMERLREEKARREAAKAEEEARREDAQDES